MLALAAVNYRGVTRTARLTRVIVAVVLLALVVAVAAGLLGGKADPANLTNGSDFGLDLYGVLQSAGLLFFAFAGYARIATMGEEVRDPTTRSRGRSWSPSPSRSPCMRWSRRRRC